MPESAADLIVTRLLVLAELLEHAAAEVRQATADIRDDRRTDPAGETDGCTDT